MSEKALDEAVPAAGGGKSRQDAGAPSGVVFGDRDALDEARRLIEKHGYGRRREELEDAEASSSPP